VTLNIASNLLPVFWGALIVALVSGAGLGVGITLLLTTVSHRKVALPLVWITAATMVAALTALILLLTHS
jgi:hypothetical protein